MTESRQPHGDETWFRLLNWTKGQKASERLAIAVLQSEGFKEVDPSHPLGGPDGGRDALCVKDGVKFVVACYFPRGQQPFKNIFDKFEADLAGVPSSGAGGIVFVTNQELTLSERRDLGRLADPHLAEFFHLERLAGVLNTPKNYGIRQEFLSIDLTREELTAFHAYRDEQHYRRLRRLGRRVGHVLKQLEKQAEDLVGYATGGDSYAYFVPHSHLFLHEGSPQSLILSAQVHGKYPVHDVQAQFFVSAFGPEGKEVLEVRRWSAPVVVPGQGHIFGFEPRLVGFCMANRSRLQILAFIQTKSRFRTQQIRVTRDESRGRQRSVHTAFWVPARAGGKGLLRVCEGYPGYVPGDLGSIFDVPEGTAGASVVSLAASVVPSSG